MLMIFSYKCISIKITKEIVNPIIFFAAHFTVSGKMKVNRIEKSRSDECSNLNAKYNNI